MFYRPPPPTLATDAPTGPYFVYGSLMDPDMLADILRHKHRPTLRPAELTGYSCKLWGQYPALQESQDGEGGAAIRGMVYRVPSVAEGARLAEYETSSYRARPCQIQYTDGRQPAEENGHVFVFVGNPRDLDEGTFDLAAWLERMGR